MTPADVFTAVADAFSIPADSITGKARPQNICDGRHLAVWILRHHLRMTNGRIGKLMDRTPGMTVHGVRRAQELMTTDKHYHRCAAKAFAALNIEQEAAA